VIRQFPALRQFLEWLIALFRPDFKVASYQANEIPANILRA
jgi:hypothetical protein